jgi:hypothetical protein
MAEAWAGLLNPTTVVGVFVVGGILVYLWRKDVNNPSQAASVSVISSSVEYSSSVFEVAQEAMTMAKDAMAANYRCEKRTTALISYNRTLIAQLTAHGLVPAEPPPGLMGD